MKKTDTLNPIKELYENSLEKHGAVSAGVGWPDEKAHLLRFDKLSQIIDTQDPLTINDLGCGYGAFFNYLKLSGHNIELFRGLDISDIMVQKARLFEPSGDFEVGSALTRPADYSFACGIFNVRLEQSEDDWRVFTESVLDNLAEYSKRGFAFNMLTSYVDFRKDHLYYADPLKYFDLCKKKYSGRVSLIHDYNLFEWTMIVKL